MAQDKERVPFTTTLNIDLLKRLKHLAIDKGKSTNDLIEEAIKKILIENEKPVKK